MTIDQMLSLFLVILFATGAILAVFYLWFSVWKYISDHCGNIVNWDENESGEKESPDDDGDKEK